MTQKNTTHEDLTEMLNAKYGKDLIKFYKQFLQENTRESYSMISRNKEYMKSIPKFTFNLDRDLFPGFKSLLEELKLKVSV
jgi:hypothetical protein